MHRYAALLVVILAGLAAFLLKVDKPQGANLFLIGAICGFALGLSVAIAMARLR